MIKDLEHASSFTVSEDSAAFTQLVDAMYAPFMKEPPLSKDNIDNLSGQWYSIPCTRGQCMYVIWLLYVVHPL